MVFFLRNFLSIFRRSVQRLHLIQDFPSFHFNNYWNIYCNWHRCCYRFYYLSCMCLNNITFYYNYIFFPYLNLIKIENLFFLHNLIPTFSQFIMFTWTWDWFNKSIDWTKSRTWHVLLLLLFPDYISIFAY